MELQREADRLLLARYVPPAVLINEHLEILQTRGRTASFLELPSGKASLNLLKMARPGLLFELQGAIDEARKQGFEAMRQHVRVEDEKTKTVTIRVVPFKVPSQAQHSFLIIFESESPDRRMGCRQPRSREPRSVVESGSYRGAVFTGKTDRPIAAGAGGHQGIPAVHHRVAGRHERGTAVGQRRDSIGQRRAAKYKRRVADLKRGTGIGQRRTAYGQRGDAASQRAPDPAEQRPNQPAV